MFNFWCPVLYFSKVKKIIIMSIFNTTFAALNEYLINHLAFDLKELGKIVKILLFFIL